MKKWDEEKKLIKQIQKCQRNYDYSKWDSDDVHYQQIKDHLLWVATNSPSKQHEGYYDVYWTMNREVIQEISRYTWGYTYERTPPSNWRNAQANASLYILWVAKEPNSQLNYMIDGTPKSNTMIDRWKNAYASVGISIGLTMRAAAEMGLSTGCNKSHNDINGNNYWLEKLGILDDVNEDKKEITYGLGIGYPKEGVPRWVSDETEIMIGAANGTKITTTDLETHPRTGKKLIKGKIVNLNEFGGKEVEDEYGNIHEIPTKAEFGTFSTRDRGIEVIEIK
tara:strand:- start:296 stop:1135 length:840 start_codon:yes stop_codon:yes gene_type:complete